MTTHTLRTGTVAQLNAAVPEPVALKASLTDILNEPIASVRSAILNAFMASLNLALISQCRSHVRFGDRAAVSLAQAHEMHTPTIDVANELAADEDTKKVDDYFTDISGGTVEMSALDVARRLGFIRKYALDIQRTDNIARPTWQPRALAESIEFLVSQMPTEINPTDPSVLVLAAVLKKDPKIVAAMSSAAHKQDREQLLNDAGEILDLSEKLSQGDDFADDHHLAEAVEQAFDTLPPITQINVFTSACNSVVTAYNSAFKRVLRGRADAAADMSIAESLYKRAVLERNSLITKHAAVVADVEDRGGQIKALKVIA